MKFIKDVKILIVGLGLMGGSYADGLTSLGYEVGAVTRKQSTIDFALNKGIISHGMTEPDGDYIGRFDIIVFALYPHVFMDWIRENQRYIKKGALLTDVTGVKGSVVYNVQELLRDDLEFIAAHPMAGKEKNGVRYASRDIFRGANYIVTPTPKNTPGAIESCKELGRLLGFKNIMELSPQEHDEMIGFLSQLTHCIAVSLMVCKDSKHLVEYTGDSFRDFTRIASINDEMWSELFLLNKKELLKQMDLFADRFGKLRGFIENDDTEGMREMMRLSTERRSYFSTDKD
ncbi:MAG TPA: prephenate dehydrogenase/arogenate dehydrogenase family protein [Lachnospiraceae bacterium]|nr:prephenate dehydrogenase/arogenate dehydrogenase family protein [Lachnospiraceae bacterium]